MTPQAGDEVAGLLRDFLAADRDRWEDQARWRGRTDVLVQANVQRMGEFAAQQQANHAEYMRRADKAEQALADFRAEARGEFDEVKRRQDHTNGDVSDLKSWRDTSTGEQAGAERVKVEVRQENIERRDDRRYTLRTLIGTAFGACAAMGGLGGFLTAVGVLHP